MSPIFEPDFDPKRPLVGIWTRFPHAHRKIHFFYGTSHLLMFRPHHAPEDWWGTLGHTPATINVRNVQRLPNLATKRFNPHLKEGRFFRLFVLPDPIVGEKRRWLVQWHPQIGYLMPESNIEKKYGAYFRPVKGYGSPKNHWKVSTQDLIRHFEREWFNSESDVRQAMPWCDLTARDRTLRALQWEKGCRDDLTRILRAALICESELWKSQGDKKVDITIWPDRFHIQPVFLESNFGTYSTKIYRLTQYLEKTNKVSYTLPIGTRNDWPLPWAKSNWQKYEPEKHRNVGISLSQSPPSQHEVLEESLFLRAWLIKNAPDLMDEWFST